MELSKIKTFTKAIGAHCAGHSQIIAQLFITLPCGPCCQFQVLSKTAMSWCFCYAVFNISAMTSTMHHTDLLASSHLVVQWPRFDDRFRLPVDGLNYGQLSCLCAIVCTKLPGAYKQGSSACCSFCCHRGTSLCAPALRIAWAIRWHACRCGHHMSIPASGDKYSFLLLFWLKNILALIAKLWQVRPAYAPLALRKEKASWLFLVYRLYHCHLEGAKSVRLFLLLVGCIYVSFER